MLYSELLPRRQWRTCSWRHSEVIEPILPALYALLLAAAAQVALYVAVNLSQWLGEHFGWYARYEEVFFIILIYAVLAASITVGTWL